MFSKFYYKRKLKSYKAARQVDRGFLNLKEVSHLVVAVECKDFSEIKEIGKDIKRCFNDIPKVSFLIFLNIKSVEEYACVVDSSEMLLCKADLLRKLTPKDEVIKCIDALKPDVFVNLNHEASPVIDFLTSISTARMRVGFEENKEYIELIINASGESGYQPFFEKMKQVMRQINAK